MQKSYIYVLAAARVHVSHREKENERKKAIYNNNNKKSNGNL